MRRIRPTKRIVSAAASLYLAGSTTPGATHFVVDKVLGLNHSAHSHTHTASDCSHKGHDHEKGAHPQHSFAPHLTTSHTEVTFCPLDDSTPQLIEETPTVPCCPHSSSATGATRVLRRLSKEQLENLKQALEAKNSPLTPQEDILLNQTRTLLNSHDLGLEAEV